jgi:hypothetical protein
MIGVAVRPQLFDDLAHFLRLCFGAAKVVLGLPAGLGRLMRITRRVGVRGGLAAGP